jgi:hypothetical protein
MEEKRGDVGLLTDTHGVSSFHQGSVSEFRPENLMLSLIFLVLAERRFMLWCA